MKISQYAIQQIAPIIIGSSDNTCYKSGPMLVAWFNKYGARDVYDKLGLPVNPNDTERRMSRTQYAIYTLSKFNDTDNLKNIIEDFINDNKNVIGKIQEIIEPEGFTIHLFDSKYHIIGCKGIAVNTGVTDAYFENLQNQVIGNLKNAKLSILVAMAWFTNQKIADTLKEKAKENVDVRLVIHRDHINEIHGANLDGLNVKYMQAPKGGVMHDKFCVIDNRFVITGSYNWSVKAETKNEENILIDNTPDTVMKYSIQFKKLYYEEK